MTVYDGIAPEEISCDIRLIVKKKQKPLHLPSCLLSLAKASHADRHIVCCKSIHTL